MINLPVDESYAFDFLSILEVKAYKNKKYNKHTEYTKIIIEQIGQDLYEQVYSSQEYKELLSTNFLLFSLIDKVKEVPELGKDIDKNNYKRFLIKSKIQVKFFNNRVTEEKIGYECN